MSIGYLIDHNRKLVLTKARGTLTDQDIFGYQLEVWSRPDVAGYNELVDMSEVEVIVPPSGDRMRQLAFLSAWMDAPSAASKFAIFAPQDLAFGLGRMYEANRNLEQRGTKRVGVFRTLKEALEFLDLKIEPEQLGWS